MGWCASESRLKESGQDGGVDRVGKMVAPSVAGYRLVSNRVAEAETNRGGKHTQT